MTNKIKITINGFEIKSLGNAKKRIEEKFDILVDIYFIRSYSAPMINIEGFEPEKEVKQEISKILTEEVEFGLLVDEY